MDSKQQAQDDFERAYRRGFWRKLSSWLTGEQNELLPFDEVRDRLPFRGQHYIGLKQVKIDNIVGSVGRYRDFDRAFLPRQERTRGRWINVDSAHYEDIILPPVDLFKIGEIYFVRDGNHRISVAREQGQDFVDAHVTEIEVPVDLHPDMDINELELKSEYASFIEQTGIDEVRPQSQIELTLPGEYERLLEHISVHRWYLGEERERDVPYKEAVASWYDDVYSPLMDLINKNELLDQFPERTEADLYLWIIEYEWFVREAYRNEFSFQVISSRFKERFTTSPSRKLISILKKSGWVDNLILEQEKLEFFARTGFRDSIPDASIEITQPGQYSKLLEDIDLHRWYLGEQQGQEINFEEAAVSWYEEVYSPLVEFIHAVDILGEFPGRTETDLYIWILQQQTKLRRIYGGSVSWEDAIEKMMELNK
jgi:uncharacterized membrane protein YfbV (UPF0208 family)